MKYTIEYCCNLARERQGECLSKEYKNKKTNMIWKCKCGHTWEAVFGNINRGGWCRICFINGQKNTIEDCIELAKKKDGQFLSDVYVNALTDYVWRCKNGHSWSARYNDVYNGNWCPHCSERAKHNISDCIELASKNNGKFLSDTYDNNHTKYKWECNNGHVWEASFHQIDCGAWCKCYQQEKTRQTFIKNYGVEHPSQNKDIALKTAKSCNNSFILYHWKSGEELVCQGSWEKKVIEYLNKNTIDFQWQNSVYTLPSGKTYRPDMYLINENKWVEIKGYFRKDAQEKWDWFHSQFPNSELWDKKKLKELKIL